MLRDFLTKIFFKNILECKYETPHRKSTPTCKCEPGYYDLGDLGDQVKDCEICEYPCLTCKTSPLNCLSMFKIILL